MEITQINIPHIPDLQAAFSDIVEATDVEMDGIVAFLKKNGLWILMGIAIVIFFFVVLKSSKKTETDMKEEPPPSPFHQPITFIQRPNGNVG